MLKALNKYFKRCISLTVILLLSFSLIRVMTLTGFHTYASYQTISPSKLKKYSRSMKPLVNEEGLKYCSSSHIKYKNKVFSVTNRHCCETVTYYSPLVNIGGSLEIPLFISTEHDVCVLSATKVDKALKLSSKDMKMWQPILIMGYPRGTSLTPQAGVVILLNIDKEIGGYVLRSHEASIKIMPGNSGSPVLNKNGYVVGLVYATYMGEMVRGILVPLKYVEDALKEAYKVK